VPAAAAAVREYHSRAARFRKYEIPRECHGPGRDAHFLFCKCDHGIVLYCLINFNVVLLDETILIYDKTITF
jgi:hypothetical protein